MGSDGGGAAAVAGKVVKRAEVDTRAPFRSVKEAVTLFGEKVLAGELIYSNKIKQVESKGNDQSSELEETKQNLEKAKEESTLMANSISLLRQELEKTKHELRQLKLREIKVMKQQSTTNIPIPQQPETMIKGRDVRVMEALRSSSSSNYRSSTSTTADDGVVEFQKKRYVTFANPPSLARVMVPSSSSSGGDHRVIDHHQQTLERHPSLRKKKKKPLIPLIGVFFSSSKRKGHNEVA